MIGSRFALPLKMCAGRNLFRFLPIPHPAF